MLTRRGAELNVKDYLGGTPLWYAYGHHDGTTARMLIAGGADPNLRLTDGPGGTAKVGRKGATPFLLAAETADLTRGQILQQAGLSIVAQANSLPQSVLSLLQ